MDTLWLLPLALVLFFAWAVWFSRKRGPNRPGEEDKWHPRGGGFI